MGENCTTGCATKDHATYGQCLKAKRTVVAYCNSANGQDYTAQKNWDRELDAYKDARRQGIEPAGTKMHQIENAVAISNEVGVPYKAAAD